LRHRRHYQEARPVTFFETMLERLSESFLGYLHLWTWLDQKITHQLSGRPQRTFDSVSDFWGSALAEDISPGDRVRFKEAFVTDWIPRSPGRIWHGGCDKATLEHLRKGVGFFSESLLQQRTGYHEPLGVIRLPFGEDVLNYAALSITTADCWCCDLGIPLMVSSSVYDSYLSKRNRHAAVEATIEGIIQFGKTPLLHRDLLRSIGSSVSEEFLDSIITGASLPGIYISIASPLSVSFRSHDTHPPGFLWAIDRSRLNARVIHHFGANWEPTRTEVLPCEPYSNYGFLAAFTQLEDRGETLAVIDAFRQGSCLPAHVAQKKKLKLQSHGVLSHDVLTEFDARHRYFGSAVPIEREPWRDEAAKKLISSVLADLGKASLE
jgi:hypothetical protein